MFRATGGSNREKKFFCFQFRRKSRFCWKAPPAFRNSPFFHVLDRASSFIGYNINNEPIPLYVVGHWEYREFFLVACPNRQA